VRKITDYLSEVRLELAKVTWPKRDEVVKLTLIVLAISVIVGLYVGALDFVFTKLLSIFIVR
jgi:preprotein translocase subunit SecE